MSIFFQESIKIIRKGGFRSWGEGVKFGEVKRVFMVSWDIGIYYRVVYK